MMPSSLRICSGLSIAQGKEPSPPASETAITISDPTDPAIGAWMIGKSIRRGLECDDLATCCAPALDRL
jgi:hypothetical protein